MRRISYRAALAAGAAMALVLASGEAGATIIVTNDVIGSGAFGPGDSTVSHVRVGGDFEVSGTGSLEINGGSVLTTPGPIPEGYIAPHTGSTGFVTVTGPGSAWHLTGERNTGPGDPDNGYGGFLSVGRGGSGFLYVTDGGRVFINAGDGDGETGMNIGGTSTLGTGSGIVLIDGADSMISVDGTGAYATIGRGGTGAMTVQNGGTLSLSGPDAFLAVSRGGTPEGPDGPRGLLSVLDGGTVTVDGGDGFSQMVIGRDQGSDGEAVVAENSLLTIRGNEARLYVGRDGLGTMSIESGSTVLVEASDDAPDAAGVQIAQRRAALAAAGGSLTVDDANLIVADDIGAFVNVGTAGPGELFVRNGGNVTIRSDGAFLGVGREGVGTLEVTDGGTVFLDGLGGGAGINIGREVGGEGAALVSGTGSALKLVSDGDLGDSPGMTVGRGGKGRLTIADGGLVSIETGGAELGGFAIGGSFMVGDERRTGEGHVLITGAGSRLLATGDSPVIMVGEYGLGTLDLEDGGAAETLAMHVGYNDTAIGELTVGTGSTMTLSGVDGLVGQAAYMSIGAAGRGDVNVDGGQIVINGEGAQFPGFDIGGDGFANGGTGTLTVSNGGGISVQGNSTFFTVGNQGQGLLRITDGGHVSLENADGNARGYVGVAADSVGTVIVDGAGSELNAGSLLAVGLGYDLADGGTGTVSVRNGGVVRAAETRLGANGFLGGNGTVVGDVVNQGGTVAPGLSPGALTIDGDFVFETGILELEIGGTGVGEYDVLNVLGDASFLGGTILFSFVDGFLPETGDVFDVLLADAISGLANVTFDYAGLGDGFDFDFELGDDGLRFVTLSSGDPIPTPEPGAFLLLLSGLAGLGCVARTRRAAAPA